MPSDSCKTNGDLRSDGFAPSSAAEIVAHPVGHPAFDQFVATIAALRAPDGCPWDKEQTHESIAHNMIEEAYEAVDAIEANDVGHMREELGDVLLQVVLQSQIAADAGEFTIDDVCADVNEKMIRRHPHVFGEAVASNANEVLDLWDQVKLAERASSVSAASASGVSDVEAAETVVASGPGASSVAVASKVSAAVVSDVAIRKGLLDGVPRSFPALMQAQKVSRKAAAAGFEWDTLDDVWSQVREEMGELRDAYAAAPKTPDGKIAKDLSASPANCAASAVADVEMEFGDVLFSLVNVARRMGVDAESALRASCAKFRRRWAFIEETAWERGCDACDLSAGELEVLWGKAKDQEKIQGESCE